jgi:hypothetical protein
MAFSFQSPRLSAHSIDRVPDRFPASIWYVSYLYAKIVTGSDRDVTQKLPQKL